MNHDPCNTQHISSSTNPGTASKGKMSLLSSTFREDAFYSDFESTSPTSTVSSNSCCSNDKYDLTNSIFSWESYENFAKFCAKIGINLRNSSEAKIFLNNIRRQQSLPPINLEESRDCVKLLRLYVYNFTFIYDYFCIEY